MKLGNNFNSERERKHDRLSQCHWYRYYMSIRHQSFANEDGRVTIEPRALFSPITHCRKLQQQFLCDAYPAVEETKLQWARNHQSKLRADLYEGLADHLDQNDTVDPSRIGKHVVLPSGHVGNERFMNQYYQDNMAVVQKNGKPSFFITFTYNPK